MKYLKKYESVLTESTREEFIELTNNYLAYLLDDGFTFDVSRETKPDLKNVTIDMRRCIDPETLRPYIYIVFKPNSTWLDIKDIFIPYIEIIKSKYRFRRMQGNRVTDRNKTIEVKAYDSEVNLRYTLFATPDEMINDKLEISSNLSEHVPLDAFKILTIRTRLYL